MDELVTLGLAVKTVKDAPVVIYCRGQRTVAVKQPGGYYVCEVCGRVVSVVE